MAANRHAGVPVLLCGLAVLAGCRRAAEEDWLAQAQILCQQQQWDAATPLLKQCLLDGPLEPGREAAVRFHLGRCYSNGSRFYPGAAEGELQMALRLFSESGRHSPIDGDSDDAFEPRCHLELAKVHLRLLAYAVRVGAGPASIHGILKEAQAAADQARRLSPDSADVKELQGILDKITRFRSGPPARIVPRTRSAT